MNSLTKITRAQLILLIVIGVFTAGCGAPQEDEKWVDQTFYDLSYRVPASWELIRKADSVEYARSGVRMNGIKIRRFEEGDTLPETNRTVDLDNDIWTYADAHLDALKKKSGNLSAELKKQEPFPKLGNAFYSKILTKNTQGIDRVHWSIGTVLNEYYYLITVQAEQHSHLPAVKKAFSKFKTSVKTKNKDDSEEGE